MKLIIVKSEGSGSRFIKRSKGLVIIGLVNCMKFLLSSILHCNSSAENTENIKRIALLGVAVPN